MLRVLGGYLEIQFLLGSHVCLDESIIDPGILDGFLVLVLLFSLGCVHLFHFSLFPFLRFYRLFLAGFCSDSGDQQH